MTLELLKKKKKKEVKPSKVDELWNPELTEMFIWYRLFTIHAVKTRSNGKSLRPEPITGAKENCRRKGASNFPREMVVP